jgi:hypothetical protein
LQLTGAATTFVVRQGAADEADYPDVEQTPQGPLPGNSIGGISSLAVNTEVSFEVDLTSGEYLLLCFVTAPDGRPHTQHGMIQHIRSGYSRSRPAV